MKKIVAIALFQVLFQPWSYTQNYVNTKFVITGKSYVSLPVHPENNSVDLSVVNPGSIKRSSNSCFSILNSQPCIVLKKSAKKPVSFFTEISFTDLLENSMTGINADWLYSYDDHIAGLFKDAPSLFKLKCRVPF